MPPRRRSKRIAAAAASSQKSPPSEPSAASQFWGIDHLRRGVITMLGRDKTQRPQLLPLLTLNREAFVDVVAELYRDFNLYNYPGWNNGVPIHRLNTYARAVRNLDVKGSLPFCVGITGFEGLVHKFPRLKSIEGSDSSSFHRSKDAESWSLTVYVHMTFDPNGDAFVSPGDYHMSSNLEIMADPIIEVDYISPEGREVFDRRVRLDQTQTIGFSLEFAFVIQLLLIDSSHLLETWMWILKQPSFPSVFGLALPDNGPIPLLKLHELSEIVPDVEFLDVHVCASAQEALYHFPWSKFQYLKVLQLNVVAGCSIKEPLLNDLPTLERLKLTFDVGAFNEFDQEAGPPARIVFEILPPAIEVAAILKDLGFGCTDDYEIELRTPNPQALNIFALLDLQVTYENRVWDQLEVLTAESEEDIMVGNSD